LTSKVTPWYPGDIKPVREGVYQRKSLYGTYYSMFKNRQWYAGVLDPNHANDICNPSAYQSLMWRGLNGPE
jgi:hypothetical protein